MRDAQSLLDQALVQAEDGAAGRPPPPVRDMLGLADRAQTIDLFEKIVRGEARTGDRGLPHALRLRRRPGDGGRRPAGALPRRRRGQGASARDALVLPKDQAARLAALGAAVSAGSLSRLWQMLLRAYDEVRRAPDPAAAVEMALIRLAYAADLPGPEEALKALREGGEHARRRRPRRQVRAAAAARRRGRARRR